MRSLIDTSVIIDIERLANPAVAFPLEIVVLAVTVSELLAGVHLASKATRPRREALVERVVEAATILPFDADVARVHARLRGELLARKVKGAEPDLMIGATAVAHGLPVLTRNAKDFHLIPGLVVVAA